MNKIKITDKKAFAVKWITPAAFLALIFGLTIANALSPDKPTSESENRKLAQLPKFNLQALFEGKYIPKLEEYITDQFIGRDRFVGAKTQADYTAGKRDTNGIYFGSDGYLFERYTNESVNTELLNKNLERVAELIQMQEKTLSVGHAKAMLIPSSSEILTDRLPALSPRFDQIDAFNQVAKKLENNYIDVASTLKNHAVGSDYEYIYYKTDHHWTTLGAYYAYRAYCENLGITGTVQEDYTVKTVSDSFFGTLYSKARLISTKPDEIKIFEPKGEASYSLDYNLGQKQTETLYDESFLSKRDQYSYFLSGNNAVVDIKTQNKNGKTLLLLKDSFSHSLAPFLVADYECVILLDLRYYNGSVSSFINENGVTDLLAAYHFSTLESDNSMVNLTR